MNLLAVATAPSTASTFDKLKAIPTNFWLGLGLAVVALVVLVLFLRRVAMMNKAVLTVIVFVVLTVFGFNWIYERNEPAWATPAVGFLANFLPTKGPPPKAATTPFAKKKP